MGLLYNYSQAQEVWLNYKPTTTLQSAQPNSSLASTEQLNNQLLKKDSS